MPSSQNKKVIMLIIDTLMDTPIQAAQKRGEIPALQFLIENGRYFPDLVCPFPTMSVNVDSTLLTGVYCDKHKVPGLVWYHAKEKRIVNYGSHVRELLKLGLKQSMIDIFYNYNHTHLSKEYKTIHEELKEKGLETASINALLYRGSQPSQLKIPFLLSFITGLDRQLDTYKPDLFSYGVMHTLNPIKKKGQFWKKYGFNDSFTGNELKYLISENKLPAFTVAYFPDYDRRVHKHGRSDITGLKKVDEQLQDILNLFPSWDQALDDYTLVILGDNGQASINKDWKKAIIDLRKLLKSYKIVKLRQGVMPEDDIVLGVNERMSYIYTLNPKKAPLDDIAKLMQKDYRIDVIALKKENTITVTSGNHNGQFRFRPKGDYIDEYGQSWFIEGDKDILDIKMIDQTIHYREYPDALRRLDAAFLSHAGEYMIVSAKPGYEFIGEGSPTHIGGASHGGLHKHDSLISLIICGSESFPEYIRTVDIKDWIMSIVPN
ncbi:alkaline phosphatase family protein [Virgibacillus byunsanensis]|uniref:Alkaline phosphatase family protein n=1 Tax=Virgibacillus byunsanensis TaxID=570945 RepID=A0ABW3LQJ1_9BACI